MSKVYFVRGIQGSGKSTYAKAWAAEDSLHRIRVSWDDIRNMLGKYWVPEREKIVKDISGYAMLMALENNMDVIVDNMNLSDKSTESFRNIAGLYGAEIEYIDFKTPLEVCIERDSKREAPIGEKVIRETYERHKWFYES